MKYRLKLSLWYFKRWVRSIFFKITVFLTKKTAAMSVGLSSISNILISKGIVVNTEKIDREQRSIGREQRGGR